MIAGHLQIKNDYYFMVLNYTDVNGKRRQPWVATGLPAKGNKKKEYLSFQVADRFYKVNLDDIVYLESMGRDTYVVTKTETICVHAKFSDMEQQVPADRFVRCHRSYIINLSEVKDIARYRFLTKNGIEIPISQLQYTDVKKDFIEFEQ